METLYTLESEIIEILVDAQSIKAGPTIVDLSKLQQRERSIFQLTKILRKMQTLTEQTQFNINEITKTHEADIKQLSSALSSLTPGAGNLKPDTTNAKNTKNSTDTANDLIPDVPPGYSSDEDYTPREGWNYVTRGKKVTKPDNLTGSLTPSNVTATPNDNSQYTKVHITQNYFLHAVKVDDFSDLRNMVDGVLYFVASSEHFAIRIAGMFLHGNIGKIYTQVADPMKIKNCRYGGECSKHKVDCNYYHNPVYTPGGKDTRNFIATSWLYANPVHSYKNKTKARRFGDRDNIDTDMTQLSHEEGERFIDQTMHDLLCALLLHKYRKFGDDVEC